MAKSNYDVNVQLALATTAEADGHLDAALEFLAAAHEYARDDRETHARVHWLTARFHARHARPVRTVQQLSLGMFASAL